MKKLLTLGTILAATLMVGCEGSNVRFSLKELNTLEALCVPNGGVREIVAQQTANDHHLTVVCTGNATHTGVYYKHRGGATVSATQWGYSANYKYLEKKR